MEDSTSPKRRNPAWGFARSESRPKVLEKERETTSRWSRTKAGEPTGHPKTTKPPSGQERHETPTKDDDGGGRNGA